MCASRTSHWEAMLRVFPFLKGLQECVLMYFDCVCSWISVFIFQMQIWQHGPLADKRFVRCCHVFVKFLCLLVVILWHGGATKCFP